MKLWGGLQLPVWMYDVADIRRSFFSPAMASCSCLSHVALDSPGIYSPESVMQPHLHFAVSIDCLLDC